MWEAIWDPIDFFAAHAHHCDRNFGAPLISFGTPWRMWKNLEITWLHFASTLTKRSQEIWAASNTFRKHTQTTWKKCEIWKTFHQTRSTVANSFLENNAPRPQLHKENESQLSALKLLKILCQCLNFGRRKSNYSPSRFAGSARQTQISHAIQVKTNESLS